MIEEIRSSPDFFPSLRLDKAVAGDTFIRVTHQNLRPSVNVTRFTVERVLKRFTVERVLKRDVVCRDDKGRERRFNLNLPVHNAFSSDADPQLQGVIQEEKLRRLRLRVVAIAERVSRGLGEEIDDELFEALLAYDQRCEARSHAAPSA